MQNGHWRIYTTTLHIACILQSRSLTLILLPLCSPCSCRMSEASVNVFSSVACATTHPNPPSLTNPVDNWHRTVSEMAMNAAIQKHVSLSNTGSVAIAATGAEAGFLVPRGSEPSQVTFAMPTGAVGMQGGAPSYIAVNPLTTQSSTVPILAQNFASAGAQVLSKAQTLTFPQMATTDLQQGSLVQLAPVGYSGALSAGGGMMTETAMHQFAGRWVIGRRRRWRGRGRGRWRWRGIARWFFFLPTRPFSTQKLW